MSLPLWWQTQYWSDLVPFGPFFLFKHYASTVFLALPLVMFQWHLYYVVTFGSRYTADLAARGFISITATIGLQVRDVFLFGEEYLPFYEMPIYYSPNGFMSAVHCPKVCCLRGWGYISRRLILPFPSPSPPGPFLHPPIPTITFPISPGLYFHLDIYWWFLCSPHPWWI